MSGKYFGYEEEEILLGRRHRGNEAALKDNKERSGDTVPSKRDRLS